MVLNKLPYHLISIIVLFPFVIYGCDSNNANNELICSIQEMQERFANTECIAQELVSGCNNINCRNVGGSIIGEKEISFGGFSDRCTVLNCETMECELRVDGTDFEPGLMSELVISEMNGLPMGVFVIDETETPFDCVFIAIN